MKKNIEKQEKVVSALWNFASAIQNRPDEGQVISRLKEGSSEVDCKVSTTHVRMAMERILAAYGYTVVEIP